VRRNGLAIFLTLAVLPGAPLATEAQAPPRESRVGYLSIGSASDPRRGAIFDAFRKALHDLGYIEKRNVSIETRFAEGDYERLPDLAAELVRRRVDVIAAYSTPAV
jgi:putative ABC transport system substrate-binding protein